jgi:hypothetical protein
VDALQGVRSIRPTDVARAWLAPVEPCQDPRSGDRGKADQIDDDGRQQSKTRRQKDALKIERPRRRSMPKPGIQLLAVELASVGRWRGQLGISAFEEALGAVKKHRRHFRVLSVVCCLHANLGERV